MTLISNFCSEIQRWVWVFNIKSQSNSWSGSFYVSRLASCLTPRDASIRGTISWSHDLQCGLENGSCAPRQFTRFQSLCFSSSYCSSRQNLLCENEIASKYLFLDQRWLYVCMYGFVYLSVSCVWEASVVFVVGCRHWSLLRLIRAEHPETVSNDKGIWIKSDKYLKSNLSV